MAVARLVVLSGPDKGHVFDVPLRGGGIGRDVDNVVQLSDLSVSRSHARLVLRDGALVLIDGSGRNRTLINGEPIATRAGHPLSAADEITVGKTLMVFQPLDRQQNGEPRGASSSTPVRVTMEIGSRELLAASGRPLPGSDASRARQHLSAVARLGDTLRALKSREQLCRAACEQALSALSGQRAYLLVRDALGRMATGGFAVAAGVRKHAEHTLAADVLDRVVGQGKAVAFDTGSGPAIAAPVFGLAHADDRASATTRAIGVLCVERPIGVTFDDIDLTAMVTLAHLVSGTLVGTDARQSLEYENAALSEKLGGRSFIGESAPALAVRAFVGKVGPSGATVLLTGESGSGKEMVARAIHTASRRSRAPFIAVNCAALTESLIESELFGHEKGAFTGAAERKLGRFELADKGTLFLDEVGELPLACQTKFLRVLEEMVFERVGGGRSIAVDVRVVAATNRNLAEMAHQGRFREDLFYRLSVIHTQVPPLRERTDDIERLAMHFLMRLRHQVPRRVEGFTPAAMRALERHSWPGNVRELKNAIEYAIVLGDGPRIDVAALPAHIMRANAPIDAVVTAPRHRMPTAPFAHAPGYPSAAPDPSSAPTGEPVTIRARPLRELEKQGIIAALRATGGNKAQAAQLLEIDRSTLYKKIKDYKIT